MSIYKGNIKVAGGGGGSSLPDQTGQSGKFLTTNGSEASWGTPSAATVNSLGLVKPDGVTLGINNGTLYVAESMELPQDVYSRTTLLPGNNIDFATTYTGNKNYTVVGDMTIVDEVASNFSKNNYLNTPDYISAAETLDSLELVIKLTRINSDTNFPQTGIYSIGDQKGFKLTISNYGYLRLRVSEDGVSDAVDITGRNSISNFAVNTPIWVKVTYSSSSGYEMFISEDGDWWTSDADSSETFRPYQYGPSNLTYLGWNGNSPLSMCSMSLRDCYLKINGSPVWVGSTYRDVKRVDATYTAGTGIEFSNAIKQTAVTYTAHSSYVCSSNTIAISDSDVIEYQIKFKYEHQSFFQYLFSFSAYGVYQEAIELLIDTTDVNPGICQLSVKTPGSSTSHRINATSALEDGKTYFLKLVKDSSKNYKVDYSEDGETWNNLIPLTLVSDYSINSSMTAYIGTLFGVIDSAASYWLHGTWYLEDTYLKINGNYVIKGSENFGYTTIGSPTIVISYITSDKTSINLDPVEVAHLAMPSTVYEDLTIPASGTILQAPADGYIIARQQELFELSLATLDRDTDGAEYITGFFWSNAAAGLTLPVSKGGYFVVYWFGTPSKLRFVYAKGSESEYTPS